MTRAFHILVSLLVAVPLGAGGLCCCLIGQADDAQETVVAEATHSCCPSESTPSAPPDSGQSCPSEESGEDCGCPERDTALVAVGTVTKLMPLPTSARDVPALQSED